jgi:hypothetical protein
VEDGAGDGGAGKKGGAAGAVCGGDEMERTKPICVTRGPGTGDGKRRGAAGAVYGGDEIERTKPN